MSSEPLDKFDGPVRTEFSGRVRDVQYYTTRKDDTYALVFIAGVTKPLAVPIDTRAKQHKYQVPNIGDKITASDVTESKYDDGFYFVGHRQLRILNPAEQLIWEKADDILDPEDEKDRIAQAEAIILGYADTHGNSVSANNIRHLIWEIFPERKHTIVGPIFNGLAKKGIIHRYGHEPSDDPTHGSSEVPVWHRTLKKPS